MKKIVFLGTPEFAVPSLQALINNYNVTAVITQPDKPFGRGRKLKAPPVKEAALAAGIPVFQPKKLKGAFADQFEEFDADLAVVVAYGKILGPRYLKAPKLGCINVHASLLPRLRGAAPIHWAIIRGEKETGICIMKITRGLDAGPVFLRSSLTIGPQETVGKLHDRLKFLGAEALLEAIPGILSETLIPEEQDHEKATYASSFTKKDRLIDWTKSADEIVRHIRGMNPWPTTQTFYEEKPLKIHSARIADFLPVDDIPGKIILCEPKKGLVVQTSKGTVALEQCQAPGKKSLPVGDFLRGFAIKTGSCLK